MDIVTIIILILILLVLISSICVYFFFKKKVENFSNKIFGTTNIFEGFKKQELEYAETPKSVSGMDNYLIPKINKDFPNVDISELKKIAENGILLYYKSLETKKLQNIKNSSEKLNNHIIHIIETLNKESISYNNIKIHKTAVNSYENKKGLCKITFQTSLEYIKKVKKESEKIQERLNTELIYIYDEKELKEEYGVSLNCKNCGAPIKNLGEKTCPYCGTGVVEYTSKTWKINDIYEK